MFGLFYVFSSSIMAIFADVFMLLVFCVCFLKSPLRRIARELALSRWRRDTYIE